MKLTAEMHVMIRGVSCVGNNSQTSMVKSMKQARQGWRAPMLGG
jgi:hypothetical protein